MSSSLPIPAGHFVVPTEFAHDFPPTLPELVKDTHVRYFSMFLRHVPTAYSSLDTSRMTMLYFCLSALDVLDRLKEVVDKPVDDKAAETTKTVRQALIDWIYSQQVLPDAQNSAESIKKCGFKGGPQSGGKHDPQQTHSASGLAHAWEEGNLAMTYSALNCLLVLGDDLSRVNKKAIIAALKYLQMPDGSFASTYHLAESDMRFLYCACVISGMLGDWSGFDVERSATFVKNNQTYDGAVGLFSLTEGHGGSTYCGVASLYLMNKLDYLDTKALLKWCMNRQGLGFSGRPEKGCDTCYSYWVGSVLCLLGHYDMTCKEMNRCLNLQCAHEKMGGFSKSPDAYPDILHSYFATCGLSLCGQEKDQLQPIDPLLGLSVRTASKIGALRYGDKERTYLNSSLLSGAHSSSSSSAVSSQHAS